MSPVVLIKATHTSSNVSFVSYFGQFNIILMVIFNTCCFISVQVDYPFRRPQLKGGGLSGRFELRTLHFHWGKYNGRGTEHRINGRQYTMEVTMIVSPGT